MNRLATLILLMVSATFNGCFHRLPGSLLAAEGSFDLIQSLINSLEEDQVREWSNLVALSPGPQVVPAEFDLLVSVYERGFRNGYAFCYAGFGKVHESALAERSVKENAFVQGWYAGQMEAELVLMEAALEAKMGLEHSK